MTSTTTPAVTRGPLARTGRTAAVVSGVALALLIIGRIAGWRGFTASNVNSAFSVVVFLAFAITFVITIGVAVALLVKGQRSAAAPLAAYVVVAIVLSVLEGMGVFG